MVQRAPCLAQKARGVWSRAVSAAPLVSSGLWSGSIQGCPGPQPQLFSLISSSWSWACCRGRALSPGEFWLLGCSFRVGERESWSAVGLLVPYWGGSVTVHPGAHSSWSKPCSGSIHCLQLWPDELLVFQKLGWKLGWSLGWCSACFWTLCKPLMYYFEVLVLNVMFFQSDFLEKLAVQFHPVLDFSGFF